MNTAALLTVLKGASHVNAEPMMLCVSSCSVLERAAQGAGDAPGLRVTLSWPGREGTWTLTEHKR